MKKKYTLAGIIFAVILLDALYGDVRYWLSVLTGGGMPMSFALSNLGNQIIFLLPPLLLMIGAFKGKVNPQMKTILSIVYLVLMGRSILMSIAAAPVPLSTADLRVWMKWLQLLFTKGLPMAMKNIYFWRPILFVVAFCIAAFVLLPNEKKVTEEKTADAAQDKLAYYQGLLEQGIISQADFDDFKASMK